MTDSVFISYAHEDVSAAKSLVGWLENAGFSVFLDQNRLRGGNFGSQLERAIARCDVFILLISRASVRSPYVNRELHVAADDYERPIVPVVLEDADLSPFRLLIAGLQRIDFRNGSNDELSAVIDGVLRTRAEWRRLQPSLGPRPAQVSGTGTALRVIGLTLSLGGMGYFLLILALSWGSSKAPANPAIAFVVIFIGMVIQIIGQRFRRAARRRNSSRL